MDRFLWICFAGALGTGARYLVGLWAGKALGAAFPFGTLIVNIVGCFLIALVMQISVSTTLLSPTARLTLTTGFIGGLTTYSSFNFETTRLFQEGAWGTGLLNVAVTLSVCFAAGLLGMLVAHKLVGA